jgi:hypothetical protein
MSSLGSALQSLFTPSGTNAQQGQQGRQGSAASQASQLLNDLFPSLTQEANYAGSLEPQREADINRAIMLSSPGNAQARTAIYNASAQANAANAAKQAALQDQSQGLSPGFSAGQNAAIQNDAAAAENAYQQNQLSPQAALANANSALGAVSSGMAMPELPALSGLSGVVYGQPKIQVGQGLGGMLGGLAGDYLSSGLFGGGGGSSQPYDYGMGPGTGPVDTSGYEQSPGPWSSGYNFGSPSQDELQVGPTVSGSNY